MIDLCFTTDDEHLIQLSIEYWQLGENGDWAQGATTVIAKRHGYTLAKLTKAVHDSCVALTTVRCSCGQRLVATSRTAFRALKNEPSTRRTVGQQRQCDFCIARRLIEQQRLQEEKRATEEKVIQHQIQAWANQLRPRSYATAPFRDAYILYGIFSASGDLWTQGKLEAWSSHRTPLFAHPDDSVSVYQWLHEGGWIAPTQIRRGSLKLDLDGVLEYDVSMMNWALVPDSCGLSFTEVLLSLENTLAQAARSDWREVWYLVCLSELRKLLENELRRYGFSCKSWSPLIRQNLLHILDECSLAESMRIVYDSVGELVKLREDKHKNYNWKHIENMLPGSFKRRLDRIRSNSWTPFRWRRYGAKDEAIFTSLLFDTVLQDSNDYDALTGASFALENSHTHLYQHQE